MLATGAEIRKVRNRAQPGAHKIHVFTQQTCCFHACLAFSSCLFATSCFIVCVCPQAYRKMAVRWHPVRNYIFKTSLIQSCW